MARPWVARGQSVETLKALAKPRMIVVNAFSVGIQRLLGPKVVASSNLGLKVANAFGVQSGHYSLATFGVQISGSTDQLAAVLTS